MNDDPMDKSMAVALGAKRKPQDTKPHDLYNPWWDTLKKERVLLCMMVNGIYLTKLYSQATY